MPQDNTAARSLAPGRTGGNEAVCFTAGPAGAIFAIGAIHAWLAADRLPPAAVAGISSGCISAAAMQRAYRELEQVDRKNTSASQDELEFARRKWFRRYLEAMSGSPLDVIWKAFPNPIDFLADTPPVRDLARPKALAAKELESRKHYFRLTRLGIWLGGLPLRVSTFAKLTTHYVRAKERYAVWPLQWFFVTWQALKIGVSLLWHIATTPLFIFQIIFREERKLSLPWQVTAISAALGVVAAGSLLRGHPGYALGSMLAALVLVLAFVRNRDLLRFSPLLGWKTWLTATVQLVSAVAALGLYIWYRMTEPAAPGYLRVAWISSAVVALGILAVMLYQIWRLLHAKEMTGKDQAIGTNLLKSLGIETGLLRGYELHRRLLELFGEIDERGELNDDLIRSEPMHLIIVASPLEGILKKGGKRFEVVASAGKEMLVDALRAALAIPGIFPPVAVDPSKWGVEPGQVEWGPQQEKKLHLVDGVVFRQNPLPRFLSWMRHDAPSNVHVDVVCVLYNVPIEPRPDPPQRESVNIFHAASESMKLEKRRDTRQQARQVAFLSALHRFTGTGITAGGHQSVAVDVTEIAPQDDIAFANGLDPTREEVLKHAANGCRRTLEALYGPDQAKDGDVQIHCATFLTSIAQSRQNATARRAPGLPEICAHCSQYLNFRKRGSVEAPDPGVERTFGTLDRTGAVNLHKVDQKYKRLDGETPATVVLTSGGVFRGVTHIGFIGALVAAGISPDLVIGSSVGALMGSVLCALSEMSPHAQRERLRMLTDVFLRVDQKVALTRPLKNALKQLGIRGRRIRLSPAQVRRMLRRGATADAGFAATGAPPALIDAISDLFLIPHQETSAIACEFVAGHFTIAAKYFWEQVQKETLPKLDIETALIGTSLLASEARQLMRPAGKNPGDPWYRTTQPYNQSKFFCVASDLNRCGAMLLGRDSRTITESYDFVEACLSSSAFPAVFSPRPESHVFPGAGLTNVLFSDGGMFDNLPIFPAIEVMNKVQVERTGTFLGARTLQDLQSRYDAPHLFFAVALDAAPDPNFYGEYANLSRIYKRAKTLKAQVKSEEFENSAKAVCDTINKFLTSHAAIADPEAARFLNSVVVAEILRIVPSDKDHINPTFAFCRTTGLQEKRVEQAVANGCFRTLLQVAEGQQKGGSELRSVLRLPLIAANQVHRKDPAKCAHFCKTDAHSITCPFEDVVGSASIRSVCANDRVHLKEIADFISSTARDHKKKST